MSLPWGASCLCAPVGALTPAQRLAGGDGQSEALCFRLGESAVLELLCGLGECLVVGGDSETSRRTLKVRCLLLVADESDVVVFVLDDRHSSSLLVIFFFYVSFQPG